jgi:hypothetical protein
MGSSLVLVLKVYLLFAFPFTGDEAYFVQWGHDLSAGYYDHSILLLCRYLGLGSILWEFG